MDTQARVDNIVEAALLGDRARLRTVAYGEIEAARTEERELVLEAMLIEAAVFTPREHQFAAAVRRRLTKAQAPAETPLAPSSITQREWLARCNECGLVYDYWTVKGLPHKTSPAAEDTRSYFTGNPCGACNSRMYSIMGSVERVDPAPAPPQAPQAPQAPKVEQVLVAEATGRALALQLGLNPRLIVDAFLAALESSNQHDLYRIVETVWSTIVSVQEKASRSS